MYGCFFWIKRKQKKRREENRKPSRAEQKMIDYLEWFYNIPVSRWYRKHPSKHWRLNRKRREQKIIVSLTSYPKRIPTVWMTVETLLRQNVKPDQVILWLAENQFDGTDSLPEELLRLQKGGLTIRFCDDLKSHKKYFYVMQEYPEDIIILADDDIFYPYNTIKKLMKMHRKYPEDICTMTAQVIDPGFEAMPSVWRNPRLNERFEHSGQIQVFTGSGSLYPPHVLRDFAFDVDKIKKICPYADDLWLTFMAKCSNTKITARHPWTAFPVMIDGTARESLWQKNAAEGENDKQWKALLKEYRKITGE